MASVIKRIEDGRTGWRVRFYLNGRQKSLYLSGASKRVADAVGRHCDELAQAMANNVAAAPESILWAAGTDGKLRETLVAWGMAEPVNPRLATDAGKLLGAYCQAYINGRTDTSARTRINYSQARRLLVEHFGERKPLRSITPADASRWQRWMLAKPLAVASVSMHVKRAKTMFSEAVRDRLLNESPFAGLKGGCESNHDRHRFIDRATTVKVLDACPDADWRVVFALCRYAGLRCPSEVLSLKWSDVDWAEGRLRIDAPKTGLRFCPLFPELRAVLSDAFESAAEGAVYCVGRYHGDNSNLRTQLGRILERAGVIPWPKLFQNLRATRRTELQEQFPSHVIDAWMGHSTKVAEKHYLIVTDEHWGRAIDSRVLTGVLVSADHEPLAPITDFQKPQIPLETMGADVCGELLMGEKVSPGGFEPPTFGFGGQRSIQLNYGDGWADDV